MSDDTGNAGRKDQWALCSFQCCIFLAAYSFLLIYCSLLLSSRMSFFSILNLLFY